MITDKPQASDQSWHKKKQRLKILLGVSEKKRQKAWG
jgi:hypothetical protein